MSRMLIAKMLVSLLCLGGCATVPAGSTTAAAQASRGSDQVSDNAAGVVLPEGEGKTILERACTSCHDLAGLTLYKGYYDEALWRGVVVDMVRVGAQVREEEVDVLAEYLDEHFGTGG